MKRKWQHRWGELIHDEDYGGSILPIMMLHFEHDPDSQMRPSPISREKREELLQRMIAGLTHIYRYFEPHRRALASLPAQRVSPRYDGRRAAAYFYETSATHKTGSYGEACCARHTFTSTTSSGNRSRLE